MSQPEAGPSTRPQSQLQVLRFAGAGINPQAIIQRFTHETTLYRALELRSVFFYNLYELEMCLLESRPARHGNIRRHPPLLIEAPRIKHFRQPAQWILEDRAKKHRRDRILRHDPRERRERDDTRPLTLKDVSNVDLKYWKNLLAPFISIAFDNSNLMCHREFPFHDDFSWARNIQSLSFTRIHLHSTTLFKVLIASCPRLRSLTLKEISYSSDKALSSHSFPSRDEFASEGRKWGDPIYLEELNLEDLDYRIAEDVLAWFNKMHHKQLVSLSRLKRFKVHVDPFRISSEDQILLERYRGFDGSPPTPRRRGHAAFESRATSSRPPTPIFLPPSSPHGERRSIVEPFVAPPGIFQQAASPEPAIPIPPPPIISTVTYTGENMPEHCDCHIMEHDVITAANFPNVFDVEKLRFDVQPDTMFFRLGELLRLLRTARTPIQLRKIILCVNFTYHPEDIMEATRQMDIVKGARQQQTWRELEQFAVLWVDLWIKTPQEDTFREIYDFIGRSRPISEIKWMREPLMEPPIEEPLGRPSVVEIREGGREAVIDALEPRISIVAEREFPDIAVVETLAVKIIPAIMYASLGVLVERLNTALNNLDGDAVTLRDVIIVIDMERVFLQEGMSIAALNRMKLELEARQSVPVWQSLEALFMQRLLDSNLHIHIQLDGHHVAATFVQECCDWIRGHMPYLPDGRLRLFHDTLAGLVPMFSQAANMGDIAAAPAASSTAPDGGRFDEPYAPGPEPDQYEPEAFGGQSKDVPHPESPLPSEVPPVAPFIEREELLPRPTWNDLPMHLRLTERVRKTFRAFQQPRGRGLDELHMGSFFTNRESSDYPDVALMKSITIDTLPSTTVEQIELLAESLAHTAHETRDPVRLQEISIRIHDDNGQAGADLADAPSWRHMAALLGEARFAHLTLNVMVFSPNAEHLGSELEERLQQIMPEGALTVYVSSPDQSSTSSR